MKRVHVPEIEDWRLTPRWLRDSLTRQIRVMCRVMGCEHAIASVLGDALVETSERHVVDMGSGAGGIMPEVLTALRARGGGLEETRMTLSDRFPNREAIAAIDALAVDGLDYLGVPVDATNLEAAPDGVKTMINSFHHLRPREARAVLESAHASQTPILIFELADNRLPFLLWAVTLPLGLAITFAFSLLLTPFVRPLTARQLLFTYVVPLVPLMYAWDGQASYPRIYGPADVPTLTAGLGDGYRWTSGDGRNHRGKKTGFYLLGTPAPASADG